MIRLVLNRLGITGAQCGQGYIEQAVAAVRTDRSLLKGATMRLYPMVAHYLGTTAQAVGRGIGYSLKRCWDMGNRALLEEVAGYALTTCPYPREFIAMLADYLDKMERETG